MTLGRKKRWSRPNKDGVTNPDVGDVFLIPIGDGTGYIGQVVAAEILLPYIVVFDLRVEVGRAAEEVDRALASEPLLVGLTMDALFRPGRWTVVSHREVENVEDYLPVFKVHTPRGWILEYVSVSITRPASDDEVASIPYRKSRSPAIFEHALQARHGLSEDNTYYDDLSPDKVALARDHGML